MLFRSDECIQVLDAYFSSVMDPVEIKFELVTEFLSLLLRDGSIHVSYSERWKYVKGSHVYHIVTPPEWYDAVRKELEAKYFSIATRGYRCTKLQPVLFHSGIHTEFPECRTWKFIVPSSTGLIAEDIAFDLITLNARYPTTSIYVKHKNPIRYAYLREHYPKRQVRKNVLSPKAASERSPSPPACLIPDITDAEMKEIEDYFDKIISSEP